MDNSTAIDQTFDVIDIMAKAGKITQARAIERIEELLDQYELGETLWVEEKLYMDVTAGHSLKN